MNYWKAYTSLINRNCLDDGDTLKNLSYWRDNLFAGTLIYLLPFCLIALLPGLYLDFIYHLYILSIADCAIVIAITVIAFRKGLDIAFRKSTFICCIYLLSCVMLYYLGLYGPGLIFLLACCLFSLLILPSENIFWPAWLNTIICGCFAVAILLKMIPWNNSNEHPVTEWIAVSANVVFLSFLFSALMPRVFNGLQRTIDKANRLKEKLNAQRQSLQQALQMLHQKNKELEQFAYIASHDLKEPLRMITSFMKLLNNKYSSGLDEKANKYIGFALQGGARMQKMIDDLLELSRTARSDIHKEPADLNDILKAASDNIFKLAEESKSKIIVLNKLPTLIVYHLDILRLFQNLLINAIKFRKSETDPVIEVDANEHLMEWIFSIADNGIGIGKDKHEKIFEIFSRLHSQQTFEGSGIGLSVCKKVVENHGGRIWVESEEGDGSTFYFTIEK